MSGTEENTVCLVCPKYDPEELYVRVAAYNSMHEEQITGAELKEDFSAGGGETLTTYMDWYYEGGDGDIEKYWGELEIILGKFREQNPNIIGNNYAKNMGLEQLEELIRKKNDPSYEINLDVMKEQ